jgi:hypothetical protein
MICMKSKMGGPFIPEDHTLCVRAHAEDPDRYGLIGDRVTDRSTAAMNPLYERKYK